MLEVLCCEPPLADWPADGPSLLDEASVAFAARMFYVYISKLHVSLITYDSTFLSDINMIKEL